MVCHDKFGSPPFFCSPPVHIFQNIWTPPYISEIYGPHACYQLYISAEVQKGQGLGSGYKWLAGLVSRVYLQGSAWGSKYHVTGVIFNKIAYMYSLSCHSFVVHEAKLACMILYGCTCILMTVTSYLQSSNLASITVLMNNSLHTSAQFK